MRHLLRREPEVWALGILLLAGLIVGYLAASVPSEAPFRFGVRPDFESRPPVIEFIRSALSSCSR